MQAKLSILSGAIAAPIVSPGRKAKGSKGNAATDPVPAAKRSPGSGLPLFRPFSSKPVLSGGQNTSVGDKNSNAALSTLGNGKGTLLHFIVAHAQRACSEALAMIDELEDVEDVAARLSLNECENELVELFDDCKDAVGAENDPNTMATLLQLCVRKKMLQFAHETAESARAAAYRSR